MRFKTKIIYRIRLLILLIPFLLAGCDQGLDLSSIPEIKFKEYKILRDLSGVDSCLKIIFTFTDGDGDLGLAQSDTLPPFDSSSKYYYNLFIHYYEYIDTAFTEVTINPFSTDTVRFDSRFPDLTPNTNSKAIKGEFEWSLNRNTFSPIYSNTIKFHLQICDRKLHLSNIIETPSIIFNP